MNEKEIERFVSFDEDETISRETPRVWETAKKGREASEQIPSPLPLVPRPAVASRSLLDASQSKCERP